jgi:hypothetical protein
VAESLYRKRDHERLVDQRQSIAQQIERRKPAASSPGEGTRRHSDATKAPGEDVKPLVCSERRLRRLGPGLALFLLRLLFLLCGLLFLALVLIFLAAFISHRLVLSFESCRSVGLNNLPPGNLPLVLPRVHRCDHRATFFQLAPSLRRGQYDRQKYIKQYEAHCDGVMGAPQWQAESIHQ